jgi:hypothetical protein
MQENKLTCGDWVAIKLSNQGQCTQDERLVTQLFHQWVASQVEVQQPWDLCHTPTMQKATGLSACFFMCNLI